jgi:hypothetical protein
MHKECSVSQTACTEWNGTVNNKGYGVVRWGDSTTTAHRAAWITAHGPLPDGIVVDHLCRNRLCVNLDHLEPVSSGENTRRGRRPQVSHCPRGHPYDGDNLHVYVDRFGRRHRQCKVCLRAAQRRYEARRRA